MMVGNGERIFSVNRMLQSCLLAYWVVFSAARSAQWLALSAGGENAALFFAAAYGLSALLIVCACLFADRWQGREPVCWAGLYAIAVMTVEGLWNAAGGTVSTASGLWLFLPALLLTLLTLCRSSSTIAKTETMRERRTVLHARRAALDAARTAAALSGLVR